MRTPRTPYASQSRLRSLAIATLVALALVLLVARTVRGQDEPVVFQHGVVSDGHTWDGLADGLWRQYRIAPLQPTLSWWQREQDQADDLAAWLDGRPAANGPMLLVGHSNGGLVAREYVRRGGRGASIITVGTPHGGAPLANAWLSGEISADTRYAARAIADPVQFYAINDWQNRMPPQVNAVAGVLVDFLGDMGRFLCGGVGICNVRSTGLLAPVIRQLATDSDAYIAGLNSTANLAAEGVRLDYRGSISSTFQPINSFCYLLTTVASQCVMTRAVLILSYLQAYQFYADDDSALLSANAYRWLNGVAVLIDMDAMWQDWVGALIAYRRVIDGDNGFAIAQMIVRPSDGFLPENAVRYVNPSRPHIVLRGNLSHTMQTSSFALAEQLSDIFGDDLQYVIRRAGTTAEVRVDPAASSLLIGQTLQLSAVAYDANGASVAGRTFTWISSNPARATVSSHGLVTGIGIGTTTITVSVDGYSTTASVTVTTRAVE